MSAQKSASVAASRAELYESPVQRALLPLARRESVDTGAVSVAQGLSLRSNFVWILTGNAFYAVCQWGMIVALARLGSSFMVGQFSLGLAIATPVMMFTNLHLRAVQATDARRFYDFAEYLRLRILMTSAAMVVIAGFALLGHHERGTAMVILAVASAKGIETLSDIHYGLFQLNDRLDETGKSMMLRGVLSVAGLSAGLYLTHKVFWGCVGMALLWLAALLFFDVRRGRRFTARSEKLGFTAYRAGCCRLPHQAHGIRRQWNLVRLALPLGIVATVASINLNMPRYFIHARMGEDKLGIFSALAYATVAMTLVCDSLGHCAIAGLSRLYAGGRRAEFRSLLLKLLAVGGALGFAGLVVAQVLGERLLAIVYGPEYAAYSRVFVLLVFAASIYCITSMLTSGIMSARYFKIQVPMLALVAGCNALACARLVPAAGLVGGALAMLLAALVHLVLAAAVVGCVLVVSDKRAMNPKGRQLYTENWEPGL